MTSQRQPKSRRSRATQLSTGGRKPTVRSKRFSDFSVGVRRQIWGLNFREDSSLKKILQDEPNVMCFVRFVGKRVASWGCLSETYWAPKLTYMTFTRRADRRKGYGTECIEAAKAWKEEHMPKQIVIVFPGSFAGRKFYENNGMIK